MLGYSDNLPIVVTPLDDYTTVVDVRNIPYDTILAKLAENYGKPDKIIKRKHHISNCNQDILYHPKNDKITQKIAVSCNEDSEIFFWIEKPWVLKVEVHLENNQPIAIKKFFINWGNYQKAQEKIRQSKQNQQNEEKTNKNERKNNKKRRFGKRLIILTFRSIYDEKIVTGLTLLALGACANSEYYFMDKRQVVEEAVSSVKSKDYNKAYELLSIVETTCYDYNNRYQKHPYNQNQCTENPLAVIAAKNNALILSSASSYKKKSELTSFSRQLQMLPTDSETNTLLLTYANTVFEMFDKGLNEENLKIKSELADSLFYTLIKLSNMGFPRAGRPGENSDGKPKYYTTAASLLIDERFYPQNDDNRKTAMNMLEIADEWGDGQASYSLFLVKKEIFPYDDKNCTTLRDDEYYDCLLVQEHLNKALQKGNKGAKQYVQQMKNKEIKRQQAIKAANDARAQELKAEVNKLKSKKMF